MNVFLCAILCVCVSFFVCAHRSVSRLSFLIKRQISHQRSSSLSFFLLVFCVCLLLRPAAPPSRHPSLPLLVVFTRSFHHCPTLPLVSHCRLAVFFQLAFFVPVTLSPSPHPQCNSVMFLCSFYSSFSSQMSLTLLFFHSSCRLQLSHYDR